MSTHLLLGVGLIVVAVAAGAYGVYKTKRSWQLRQSIAAARSASAASVGPNQGPVELSGSAEAAEYTFTSPLTQQDCVAYRFQKEEKQKKRVRDHTSDDNEYKTKYEWVTVGDEEAGAPFYLDDGVGRILVDGATANLDMERSYEVDTDDVEQGIGEKAVATVKGLVGGETESEEYEIPDKYVEELRNTSYGRRYKEWVVHVGEEVYVYGEAVSPSETPLGSGVEDEMSAAADAMQGGGVTGLLTGLVDFGAEAVTDPQTRYKPRAIQRLAHAQTTGPDGAGQETGDTVQQSTGQGADTAGSGWDSNAGRQDQDWQDFSQQQEAQNPQTEQVTAVVEQAESVAQDRLPSTPALENERAVVSWGQQAPTFVVSDQGKGSVLRDYLTDVLKYGLVALVGVAIAVGAVVGGVVFV